jgi:hypothetical protein
MTASAQCSDVRRPKGSDERNRGRLGRLVQHPLWGLSNGGVGGVARSLASRVATVPFAMHLPVLGWLKTSLGPVATASADAGKGALRCVLPFRLDGAVIGRAYCGSL